MIRHLILATLLVAVIALGLSAMLAGLMAIAFVADQKWAYVAGALAACIWLVATTNWLMDVRDAC